jgi:hypothetical protein
MHTGMFVASMQATISSATLARSASNPMMNPAFTKILAVVLSQHSACITCITCDFGSPTTVHSGSPAASGGAPRAVGRAGARIRELPGRSRTGAPRRDRLHGFHGTPHLADEDVDGRYSFDSVGPHLAIVGPQFGSDTAMRRTNGYIMSCTAVVPAEQPLIPTRFACGKHACGGRDIGGSGCGGFARPSWLRVL